LTKAERGIPKRSMIVLAVTALLVAGTLGAYGTLQSASAATPPLGAAADFAVLASSGITNTGTTTITGDVGSYPTASETGFGTVTITGTNNAATAATQTALGTAITTAEGYAATTIPTALDSQVLVPGVYTAASTAFTLSGGILTLNGEGSTSGVWVFQAPDAAAGALTTTSGSTIVLENGADSCDVFWVTSAGGAIIGGSNTFIGTILAYSSVTIGTGTTIQGAAMANTGDVTMAGNAISNICVPSTISSTSSTTTSTSSTTTSTSSTTTSTGTTTATSTTTTSTSTTANNCANPASPVTLTVKSETTHGTPLYGYYVLYNCAGITTQSTGFTTATFAVVPGMSHIILVLGYGCYAFSHWADTGSASPYRTFSITAATTFTAVYTDTCTSTPSTSSTIDVNSVTTSGTAVTGLYTTLWQGGVLLQTCFGPCTFTVSNGQSYQVLVADYGSYIFSHWTDGTTTQSHTVSIGSTSTTISLTAVFS
jgi:ice-binding like protein